jgi:stage V sporulation protein R
VQLRRDPDLDRLTESIEEIWDIAARLGLRPFPTHFEVVPPEIMYEFGAYGMPGRFSHWTHGKIYQMQKTMYDYGLSKIYELVINTNPCWAFLLESNTFLQNQFVVAHVLGHSDFFAQNAYFASTSRHMLETVKLNAERLKRYEFQHGLDKVERVLDAAISIEEHVDPSATLEDGKDERKKRARSGPYDDLWSFDRAEAAAETEPERPKIKLHCPVPQRDLLLFLAAESPTLDDWERDVLGIVRSEMLYFFPQMQTKIINEGWASYWHVQIMREMDLPTQDHLEFARLHSSVLQPHPGRLNPYYLGFTILNDIERRYNELDGSGREQLFMVRETECDVSLVRNYLTEELCEELDLFYAERKADELVITEKDWEAVRDRLVNQLSDYGIPVIRAEDADYNGNRELFLRHDWTGRALDLNYAEKTLEGVAALWGRKVWLETQEQDGASLRLSYSAKDGHQREKSSA